MLKRNCKFIKLLIVSIIISLVFSLAIPPKKTEANPLVIPAGIEAGVGAYVLGVFAVGGTAYLFGQTETADKMFDYASTTWDNTQQTVKSAWNTSVNGVMSAWDSSVSTAKSWSMPVGEAMVHVYDQARPTFYTDTTILPKSYKNLSVPIESMSYPIADSTVDEVRKVLYTPHPNDPYVYNVDYRGIGLIIFTGAKYMKFDNLSWDSSGRPVFYNGTMLSKTETMTYDFSSTPSWKPAYMWTTGDYTLNDFMGYSGDALVTFLKSALLKSMLTNFPHVGDRVTTYTATGQSWFNVQDVIYTGKSYKDVLGKDFFPDMALPKQGKDYIVRIPPIDTFIPYPKTADGVLDKTKGPLVYNPSNRTYTDKTGDVVYSPDQVTWDFPKPQIINDSQTGTKTIGFINSQTGKFESVTDTGVGVPGEYEKAKEDGVPTTNHKVKIKSKEVRQLEREGEPYSSEDLVDNDDLLTRRYFGEDGMADMDIDYTNHKQPKIHPKVPHRHDFDWTKPLGENRGPWYSVITDKLPEIGENEMYKFINFSEEISHGGESTFSYNSNEYSIVRSSMEQGNGWYFAKVSDNEEPEFYSSLAELFLGVRIENKTLEEVFDTGEVEDITIY